MQILEFKYREKTLSKTTVVSEDSKCILRGGLIIELDRNMFLLPLIHISDSSMSSCVLID